MYPVLKPNMNDGDILESPDGATSLSEPPPTEMNTTLDHIQRTYSCSLTEILLWSELLVFRFNQMTKLQDVTITIQHFDSNNTPLTSPSPQSLPDSTEKITLQRSLMNAKTLQ
jgi:hypothetical protein